MQKYCPDIQPVLKKQNGIRGFSLVELLVALVIMGLAMSAIYATFSAQHSSYYRQSDIQEIQQTSQSLLIMIKKDLLHAGYGVDKRLGVYVRDGGSTNSSDEIFINDYRFFFDDEDLLLSGEYAQTKIISGSGTDSINLEDLDIDGSGSNEFTENQYIITDDGSDKQAKINSINSTTLNLDQAASGTYVAPATYYSVDQGTHQLKRSNHVSGSAAVASNIYDLQVAYQDKDGAWYCDGSGTGEMSPFAPEEVALIRVSIVVGTRTWPNVLGPNTVSAENGPDWNGNDYGPTLHFRVYSISLSPRNFLL
ncbi:MAG: prepilin-type N-terminal cleavage/methylation domain-containing protein [Desulfohalobiaceae bacterium]|nr:prepilin-type N-terminal cleavage/methylation domain-containing protein [Desulfohalobiaceae bacterium]